MSENEEQAPLTRRERRLREQAETGALNLSELSAEKAAAEAGAVSESPAAPAAPQATSGPDDIEISPVNADGTPRSRREIRMLREQALAAREAAQAAAAPAEPEAAEPEAAEPEVVEPEAAEPEVAAPEAAEPEVAEAAEPEASDVDVPVAASPAQDFDSLISPPTEPFTVEELRAAETAGASEPEPDTSSEAAPVPAPEPKAKRKFWKKGKEPAASETPAEPVTPVAPVATETPAEPESALPAVEPKLAAEPEAVAPTEPEAVAPAAPEPALPEPVAVEPEPAAAQPEGPSTPEADAAEPEAPKQTKESYSFPDITPPEEWRSVFDDPATRNMPAQPEESQGDFDDLISRAVAQEGSTNGTSALILPSMPEDTGGLTGPLGATGELYVTGSMRLPKSLGETGGHVPLHESAEIDPITGAVAEDEHGTMAGPAPVSARHAVSARVVSGVPAVAKPTREKSKLPLVLGVTGGGLLVVVVGVGVWGAMNGFFG
ncbi:hypothetical protein ACXR2W_13030 [Leucobacter sp. HY1908]